MALRSKAADLLERTPGGDLPESFGYSIKRRLLGPPMVNEQLRHQRLSNFLALGVLSPDGISSSAYGTEVMLIELLPFFGMAAFTLILPMTGVILFVMLLVVLSYREVVTVYTRAGGSYVVARENFGPRIAQVAAVALLIDYVVEAIHARRNRAMEGYQEPAPPAGADPIGSLRAPGRAIVQGRLRTTQVRPVSRGTSPGKPQASTVLACDVADATGELTAVFYGRAHIAGLEPGTQVRLHGMVGIGGDGRPAMINPAYELVRS